MTLTVDPDREEAELRAYLGDGFELRSLQRYQETLDEEFETCRDEGLFYRSSKAYLYNLTAFAMTGTKLPYLRELVRNLQPGSRILDYGCGIGSDGLALLDAGFKVEFADFDNPSVEYLRWRLNHRGHDAPVHDLDVFVPGGFDGAFAFDVIEHVPDSFAFLAEMEARADRVMVNFLAPEPGEQALHHELPVRDLVLHAARQGLISYEIHHGRSHVVLYKPGPVSVIRSVRHRVLVKALRASHAGPRGALWWARERLRL